MHINKEAKMSNVPTLNHRVSTIIERSSDILQELTTALSLPREVLASNTEITQVLSQLPTLLDTMPPDKRNEGIARLCVACSVGLFDSAINYIWNETIRVLRGKLKLFGLPVIAQILEKDFSEKELNSLQDFALLKLCFELNLIKEDGFYYLDQCRDIRNNFSAAHPPMGNVPPLEFLNFFDRCIRYAYDETLSSRGVNFNDLMTVLSVNTFSEEQIQFWSSAISATYDSQKSRIFETLHGIFCDDKNPQSKRTNSLALAENIISEMLEDGKSRILENHSKYIISNDEKKVMTSRWFFEKLNLIHLLSDSERHGLIISVCKSLYDVHLAMNNFYNEPPFAKRLSEISTFARPEISQNTFVEVVTLCAIGNQYNVCFAAIPYYETTIKTFTPREIGIFFDLAKMKGNRVNGRITTSTMCRERYKRLVSLLDKSMVHAKYEKSYLEWIS